MSLTGRPGHSGASAELAAQIDACGQLCRRRAIAAMVAALAPIGAAAQTPLELRDLLPAATLSGSTRLTYWGIALYDVSLWVLPGFDVRAFERHAFALQMQYLRGFSNAAIASRSIDEMARQSNPTPALRQLWRRWLHDAFADVRAGDRITGVHRPGDGAVFLTNGRQTGVLPDPEFARLFFGIWLSADTSEPAMRKALLSNLGGT